jgi:hypothetical protein
MLLDLQTGERYIGHKNPNDGPSQWRKIGA